MASVTSLISQNLDLPPSCVAFCPTQPDLFVVGTYFLHPNENAVINGKTMSWQRRSGSLVLFRLDNHDTTDAELSIHKLYTLQTDFAVLDAQWSPHREKGREALAVATSSSLVEFYSLEWSADRKNANFVSSSWLGPSDDADADEAVDLLVLSLAWHPTRSRLMTFTLSNGEVQYCETEGDFAELNHSMSIGAPKQLRHELEAWTAAFSPTSSGLFSGGDDCALRYLRPNETMNVVEASWQDGRTHGAGVTAILPLSDELVVTGSYDDHVRLMFAPQTGRKQVLAEQNLEGGVWRLKMIENHGQLSADGAGDSPAYTTTLLASCMHAGARILRLTRGEDGDWRFDVMAKFTEHQSMNYGSDVQPFASGDGDARTRTVVSTSFYDKLLCLWKVDLDDGVSAEQAVGG